MGGYGALRTGLKYHENFGAIAALSAALIIEDTVASSNNGTEIINRRSYLESVFGDLDNLIGSDNDPKALIASLRKVGAKIPEIYLCCGTEDFLIENNRRFRKFLMEQDIKHTYVEGAGAHTWEFWDEYILKVLNWLEGGMKK